MVAAIWWFFTLIMVSSYTANLAAFLTIEVTTPAFRNVEELANQKAIKYGAKSGGSTANFFRVLTLNSRYPGGGMEGKHDSYEVFVVVGL